MEETPKKMVGNNCFLCSFPLIPQARIRVFGKSSVDIAHLIECAVEIDLSVFSSSNPFVCDRCYKRLLRFEKAKPNLRSLQEEIKEDFKKGANRTKRLRRNSAMMVNKIDRPNTTPTVRAIGTFAVYFSVFRESSFDLFVASLLFMKGISYCVIRRKLEPLNRAKA